MSIFDSEMEGVFQNVLLFEGKKQSINFLRGKQIPNDVVTAIIDMDVTPSKNDSISLGKYFLDVGNLETVQDYYRKFITLKQKDPSLDINRHKTFKDLEHFIDSQEHTKGSIDVQGDKTSDDIRDEAVYTDSNVEIYRADSQKKACDYGSQLGQQYSFCIARTGSGNLYSGYRLKQQSAFYFVKSKHRSSDIVNGDFEDPAHMVVIDVMPNDQLQWTWADNGNQGHGTMNTTWDKIFDELPELEVPYEAGVFQPDPLSEEESAKIKKFDDVRNGDETLFDALSYDEKMEYIKSGFRITNEMFHMLDKNQLNEFVGTGVALTDFQYENLTPNIKERWFQVRLQVLEQTL